MNYTRRVLKAMNAGQCYHPVDIAILTTIPPNEVLRTLNRLLPVGPVVKVGLESFRKTQ